MKIVSIYRTTFVILLAVMMACGTSQQTSQDGEVEREGKETVQRIDINDNTPGTWASLFSQVPGVYYTSGGPRIRGGTTSFNGSNTPLIVVDGIVANLNVVQPNEVEKIRVLKGTQASIYGIRGAGGVIEITTRKR